MSEAPKALRWLVRGAEAVALVPALAGLAMLLAPVHWACDVLASFGAQLLGLSLIFAIPMALLKRPVGAGGAVVGLLCALWVLRPPLSAAPPEPVDGEEVVVLFANVLRVNQTPEQLLLEIARTEPDVVALVEPDQAWLELVGGALPEHTHRLEHPQDDNFGVAVYSRYPLQDARLRWLGPQDNRPVPTLTATVQVGGGLDLVVGHPFPPVGDWAAETRNAWMAEVVPLLGPRSLLVGDLNAAPSSVHLQRLMHDAALRSARTGHQATWPAFQPAWVRIPIDHALVGEALGVAHFEVGAPFGSDHLPLVVTVAVP